VNSKAKDVQIIPHITATKIFNHRGLKKIMLATIPPIPRATIASIPMVDTYISTLPLNYTIRIIPLVCLLRYAK